MHGIEVVRKRSGVVVIKVHYSADPEKDPATPEGAQWYEAARKGYTEAMWRKEMEMDFLALRGKLVYEEWDRAFHVVEPYDIPGDWIRIHAVDPGLANPCAHLWGAIKPNSDIVLYDSLYETDKTVPELASMVRAKEGMDNIRWRTMDPSAWSRDLATKQQIYVDTWQKEGFVFRKGSRDEDLGIRIVHEYLRYIKELGPGAANPRLTVFSTMEKFIWEIEKWKYPEQSVYTAERRNMSEKPQDKDNHLMDAMRLMLMFRPKYLAQTGLRNIVIKRD